MMMTDDDDDDNGNSATGDKVDNDGDGMMGDDDDDNDNGNATVNRIRPRRLWRRAMTTMARR